MEGGRRKGGRIVTRLACMCDLYAYNLDGYLVWIACCIAPWDTPHTHTLL